VLVDQARLAQFRAKAQTISPSFWDKGKLLDTERPRSLSWNACSRSARLQHRARTAYAVFIQDRGSTSSRYIDHPRHAQAQARSDRHRHELGSSLPRLGHDGIAFRAGAETEAECNTNLLFLWSKQRAKLADIDLLAVSHHARHEGSR